MKSFSYLFCASLLSSTLLFSQHSRSNQPCCQVQGEPLQCYGPAYNAPAAIDVNYKKYKYSCPQFSGFIDASFIYWYAGEDGLKLASTGVLSGGTVYYAQNTTSLEQSFNYKPGFKVGLGATIGHEWTVHAEYTWYRGQNSTQSGTLSGTSLTAGTAAVAAGTNVWLVDDWFLQGSGGQALSGSSIS